LSRRLLLDTNILSELIKDPHGDVAERVLKAGPDNVCTSIIAAAEVRYGALRKNSVRIRRKAEELLAEIQVLPFDQPADVEYGKLRTALEAAGKPLAANDLLTAAHANALGATVVTADAGFKHAERLVRVLTWRR
jgi:tRNA(fMet)-specific endonuclease VapC